MKIMKNLPESENRTKHREDYKEYQKDVVKLLGIKKEMNEKEMNEKEESGEEPKVDAAGAKITDIFYSIFRKSAKCF